MQNHLMPTRSERPCRFRAGKAGSDNVNGLTGYRSRLDLPNRIPGILTVGDLPRVEVQ